jgi:hypothetical protein
VQQTLTDVPGRGKRQVADVESVHIHWVTPVHEQDNSVPGKGGLQLEAQHRARVTSTAMFKIRNILLELVLDMIRNAQVHSLVTK